MAEEPSVEEVVVPSEESHPEVAQPEIEKSSETQDPVDDKGVPLKNRAAEASRKAHKLATAEKQLVTPPAAGTPTDREEALRIVEEIAEAKVMKRLEPMLAKQFLMENPDAADMIEDINRIRSQYPEIASVDKLDVAYRIAKADRQDELIRKQVEAESAIRAQTLEKASQAGAEGTGRTKAPQAPLDQRLSQASSLKELKELEALITR